MHKSQQILKSLSAVISLLLTFNSISQELTVTGKAFDTTTLGRTRVTIILNDTLNKFTSSPSRQPMDYFKLWEDTNFVVHTKKNGEFSIKAKITDSLFFLGYRHKTKSYLVADLLKMSSINIVLEPEVCEPYVRCKDTTPKHYVFIGEKIKVVRAKEKYFCNAIPFDSKYDAEYKILQNVSGSFQYDTIKFIVYDHYGQPQFSKYQTVLLFVSSYCDELIHQKYKFCNVYATVDNKWAAPYQALDYLALDSNSTIKPKKIKFLEPVEIDITGASKEWVDKWYPQPYYKIDNNKAIAVYGNYVDELIELKKQRKKLPALNLESLFPGK